DGAVEWYRNVFGLSGPDLAPADGVVEFRIGSVWLQLGEEPIARSGAEVVTRFGVRDAAAERDRLIGLGVETGPLEHVPGAVDYFDFLDPDGNKLGCYSEVWPPRPAPRRTTRPPPRRAAPSDPAVRGGARWSGSAEPARAQGAKGGAAAVCGAPAEDRGTAVPGGGPPR